MTSALITTGAQAEDFACNELIRAGIKILARNYQCRRGEIDIIARSTESLIFVEVKFRSSTRFGHAFEMVSPQKQRKICSAANHYLSKHTQFYNHPCRFDVFALEYGPDNQLQIDWLKNAFTTG